MASLADLFNPTFLMFLGILVLVVAMVVVYFESKMREQNHKINSMLSLVSTLAEDVGGLKWDFIKLQQLMHQVKYGGEPVYETKRSNYLEEKRDTKLITVSDDESESDNESDSDNESLNDNDNAYKNADAESVDSINDEYDEDDLSMNDLSDDTNEEENLEQIKVFKINVDVENVESVNEDVEDLEDTESVDVEDVEEKPLEQEVISASELKTISINLEEPVEKIDYKKLQLPKLKSVVVEKGLATSTEASKLKKGELLKLLGIE